VRLSHLATQLQRLAPAWKGLNGVGLAARLDDAGVRWTNTGNVPRLDPAELRRVLDARGGDDDGGS
jgi:S-DNA-T family DNA segregation ATPase FtsK/SpoIIIE